MLNAHTLTRTAREAQYDIKVFLEALRNILSEDAPLLVESKWSDGSVDVTPSISIVDTIVGMEYPRVQVGDKATLVPNTAGNLEVAGAIGVSASFDELSDADVTMTYKDSRITELEATHVSIDGSTVKIGNVKSIHANTLKLQGAAGISVLQSTGLSVSGLLDMSGTAASNIIRVVPTSMGTSQLLYYCTNSTKTLRSSIILYGPVCLADSGDYGYNLRYTYSSTFRAGSKVYVRIPRVGGTDYLTSSPARVGTLGISTAFAPESGLGLLGLYPKLTGEYKPTTTEEGLSVGNYVFTLESPEPSDNYSIIEVQNLYSETLKLCNVWYIRTSLENDSIQEINAGNYVLIPPYSRIDFLLLYEELVESQTRIVRMLPMKKLDTVGA